ncbi:FecR domain-containing protein [Achromobacter insolitus]|uniref:FecR domain-containing protein n=1 Tax=Achromobacter insolitus TaxID=217204 RepID=UPI000A60E837|nr:FecR family protein [Achromobacter insolitus]AVG39872.1 histidine kinase [Achromobacter insolitus]MCP1402760.1 transmembrane sensor [Achromobacter insolitus]
MSARHGDIPEPILAQGLEWLVILWSGEASADERAAWQRWRAAHPDHERAWQQVQRIDARLTDVSPEASAQALARSGRQAGRRKALRLMGWAALGVGTAGLAAHRLPWPAYIADYRSAVGERREIALEDGTRLTLNGDSAVDLAYSADARRLVLRRGDAYIETGHGPAAAGRPFFVTTAYGEVQALGTRFSVEQQRDRIRVGVYEGAVEIQPSQGRALRLDAGQSAAFTPLAAERMPDSLQQSPGWLRGQLVAERLRLADFLDQVGRHRRGVIRCDPRVADLIVSGVYSLDDTDRILSSLARVLPLRVSRYTGYWVVIEPR